MFLSPSLRDFLDNIAPMKKYEAQKQLHDGVLFVHIYMWYLFL